MDIFIPLVTIIGAGCLFVGFVYLKYANFLFGDFEDWH